MKAERHGNIAVFVPHIGCPCRCSFCNQQVISGEQTPATPQKVVATCQEALAIHSDRALELAFFGGSFTAIDRGQMLELLKAAQPFLKQGISGIRISTRPDAIDDERLELLKEYGVTAIELGTQSMDDKVLLANNRGHSAQQSVDAARLIKEYSFELGLQMMTGLYTSTPQKDWETAKAIVALRPDTVRIYPTITLVGTQLDRLFKAGSYQPQALTEAVTLSAGLTELFYNENIRVIRVGLHPSRELEAQLTAGPYHPAFRELCEGEIMLRRLLGELADKPHGGYEVLVNPADVSRMTGQKKCNLIKLEQLGYPVVVKPFAGAEPLCPRLAAAT